MSTILTALARLEEQCVGRHDSSCDGRRPLERYAGETALQTMHKRLKTKWTGLLLAAVVLASGFGFFTGRLFFWPNSGSNRRISLESTAASPSVPPGRHVTIDQTLKSTAPEVESQPAVGSIRERETGSSPWAHGNKALPGRDTHLLEAGKLLRDPSIVLEAIASLPAPDRSSALISGTIVYEGNRYRDYTVELIEHDMVVLRKEDAAWLLKLDAD